MVIEDTGGNVTIAVYREDWIIHSVEMEDKYGKVPTSEDYTRSLL